MTADTHQMPVDLACDLCGYDLRAQPDDGKCPECGTSVAQSRRAAAIPRRPAWRDSDPRWRRRMLAGAWALVLLPLMDTLQIFGWASSVPLPNVIGSQGAVRTLDDTFLCQTGVYPPLLFCIGVVLLFAKERHRRRGPLDWTRRWGVLCSYVVLLLSVTPVLFIGALVLVGISAIFLTMPLSNQPAVTTTLASVSSAYFRYGPYPTNDSAAACVAFSSIAILLGCIPLFDALRSSGPKRLAAILLAPLALFSLMHLAQVARYYLGFWGVPSADVFRYGVYFWPELLVTRVAGLPAPFGVSGSAIGAAWVEAAKWCVVLAIAVWLSVAQLAAWWQGGKTSAA
jgi:hypothetical protein